MATNETIKFSAGDAVTYGTRQGNQGSGVVEHVQHGERGAFIVIKDPAKTKPVKVRQKFVVAAGVVAEVAAA